MDAVWTRNEASIRPRAEEISAGPSSLGGGLGNCNGTGERSSGARQAARYAALPHFPRRLLNCLSHWPSQTHQSGFQARCCYAQAARSPSHAHQTGGQSYIGCDDSGRQQLVEGKRAAMATQAGPPPSVAHDGQGCTGLPSQVPGPEVQETGCASGFPDLRRSQCGSDHATQRGTRQDGMSASLPCATVQAGFICGFLCSCTIRRIPFESWSCPGRRPLFELGFNSCSDFCDGERYCSVSTLSCSLRSHLMRFWWPEHFRVALCWVSAGRDNSYGTVEVKLWLVGPSLFPLAPLSTCALGHDDPATFVCLGATLPGRVCFTPGAWTAVCPATGAFSTWHGGPTDLFSSLLQQLQVWPSQQPCTLSCAANCCRLFHLEGKAGSVLSLVD